VASSEPLDVDQLAAYFALMEVSSLLRHAVEQQLRRDGELSYVQFEIIARLSDAPEGRLRMTDLADGIVFSRSGLTYQAGQLEAAGLVERSRSIDDERGTTVTLTEAGRALLARVLPGHVQVARELLLDHVNPREVTVLARVLGRVRDRLRSAPPRSARPRAR
jgi:DNA-binding MarR family transcriptional regulator